MLTAMNPTEALERAKQELERRRKQMTAAEFHDAVIDRARELAGLPPLARLSAGRRLTDVEMTQLILGIDVMLNDFTEVAHFGDARIRANGTVQVLFRLTKHPNVPFVASVVPLNNKAINFSDVGRHAAVTAFDALQDPEEVKKLIAKKLK